MKKFIFTVFTAIAALSGAFANNTAAIGKTSVAPVIDGKADACYSQSMVLAGFTLPRSMEYAAEQTTLQFVYDDQNLYGLLVAYQPNAGKLNRITPSRTNGKIWKHDSVELLFNRENYLVQYMLDYSGSTYALNAHLNDRLTWDNKPFASKIKAATVIEKDRWVLEFAIPRSEIGKGDLKINIVRNHLNGKTHSTWCNHEEASWRKLDKYATLKLRDNVPAMTFTTLPELKLNSQVAMNVNSKEQLEFTVVASGKKFVPENASGAVTIKYNTPPSGKSAQLLIKNKKGELLYDYTHTLATEKVTINPNNLNGGYLILDSGKMKLEARLLWNSKHNLTGGNSNMGGKRKFDYNITFEVPENITVRRGKKVAERTVDGKKIISYVQKEKFAYNAHSWLKSYFNTTLPAGSTGTIRYKVEWANGVQPFEEIKFKVIEVKPAPRPKKYISGFAHAWGSSMEQVNMLGNLGCNTISIRDYKESAAQLAREIKAAGYYILRGDYFWPGDTQHGGGHGFDKWTQEDRQARARDIGGFYIPNGSSFQISPTYRGRCYDEAIKKEIEFCKKAGINYFAFDMEGYIQSQGEKGDFCLRSINEFKKYFAKNYPGKKYIDPQVFERDPKKYPDYHKAWVNFKCDAWADFFIEMKNRFAQELGDDCQSSPFPGVLFTEWSFRRPWDIEGQNHCLRGRKFFEVFNTIELDIYTSLDRGVRETNEKLANFAKTFPGLDVKIILNPCPRPLKDYHYSSLAPDYENYLKYAIMESFGFGCVGVHVWHYNYADLDSLRQFSEAMHILNRIEDVVFNGKKIKLTTTLPNISVTDTFYGKKATWHDQEPVFVKGLQHQDKYLICVSEYLTGKDMTVTVNFAPGKKMSIKDVEANKIIGFIEKDAKTFQIRLEPENRCKLLLFEVVK